MLRLVLLALASVGLTAFAAPPVAPPPTDPAAQSEGAAGPVSLEDIERQRAELEARQDLDPGTKASALELYDEAAELIRTARDREAAAARFAQQIAEAPALRETIQRELSHPPAEPAPDLPEDAGATQIQQALDQAKAARDAAQERLTSIRSERDARQAKRDVLPGRISQARASLADLGEEPAPAPAGMPQPLAEAQRIRALAERRALEAELAAAEQELRNIQVRDELQLLDARRDRAARRLAEAEALTSVLQKTLNERRRQEAEQAARDARRLARETAQSVPQVRELAEEVESLAQMRTGESGLAEKIETASRQLSVRRAQLEEIQHEEERVERRVEIAGLTQAMGRLLRRELESLPDESTLRRRASALESLVVEAQLTLIELEERRAESRDLQTDLQAIVDSLPPDLTVQQRAEAEALANELLSQRRSLLSSLAQEYESYIETLGNLDTTVAVLIDEIISYRRFIEERILWVRSAVIPADRLFPEAIDAARWLFLSPQWPETLKIAGDELMRKPALSGLIIFAALVMLLLRNRARRQFSQLYELANSPEKSAFWHTLAALGVTLVMTAPAPLLLLVVGWRLQAPQDQTTLGIAVGAGLIRASMLAFTLEGIRQIIRPEGLAEAHFRWPRRSLDLVRRHLRWLAPVLLPCVVVIRALVMQPNDAWNESLGRAAFVVGMVGLAVFAQRVLHPKHAVIDEYLKRHRRGLVDRTSRVWFPLLVAIPLALALLSIIGYHYTSLVLGQAIVATVRLLLVLVLINALLLRWLYLARRWLALERWRERRELEQAGETDPSAGAAHGHAEHAPLGIPEINSQTRQLFRAGVFVATIVGLVMIWANILPALRILDRVQIWPEIRMVEAVRDDAPSAPVVSVAPAEEQPASTNGGNGVGAAPPGSPQSLLTSTGGGTQAEAGVDSTSEAIPTQLTLADLGLALVIVVATVFGSRNLPGLLEIAVLQRLPLQPSARFAISTVARYIIVIVGVTAAFGAIGIGWSKVQWLAAALTFGLAFGMQEIFANFVSGLIILAERPMRVGDTVTIGQTSGTVTQIRMRATTITDWDRKELIVPNKAFITDQLINWSLSDPILRVTIPVGVAYGSDIDKVERTLLSVARAQKDILDNPAPRSLFLGFGDSSLNFELRVFIPSIDHYLQVKNDLHFGIDKAFRSEDVEISFPQRDLHIRSAPALESLVLQRQAEEQKEGQQAAS